MQHISKLCSDSLRVFANDKCGIKLKASHAHELVAAYFGYKSRAALLADTKYPLSNLRQAAIIVLAPEAFINERRKELEGLSPDLPDTYTLGQEVYTPLFAEGWIVTQQPPFRDYAKFAKYIADEDLRSKGMYHPPERESVLSEMTEGGMTLLVNRFYKVPDDGGVQETTINTTIKLPRVAAHIGYGRALVSVAIEPHGNKVA
jgi:hypothetical protein